MNNSTDNNPADKVAQRLADLMGVNVAGKTPSYPPFDVTTDLYQYKSVDVPLEYIENELLSEKNDHEACYTIIGYAFHHPQEIRYIADILRKPFFRGRQYYSFVFTEMIEEVKANGYVNANSIRDKIVKRFQRNKPSKNLPDIKVFIDMIHRKPTRKLLEAAILLINENVE